MALVIAAVILAISLAAIAIHFHEKPLLKSNRCPSPRPSITIEPYRTPLPIMNVSEKDAGEKRVITCLIARSS